MPPQLASSVGRTCVIVNAMVNYGRIKSPQGPNDRIIFLILNVGEIEWVACILRIQAEATLELEVMSLKSNITEPCNWRLTS